jgi:predicted dinucleotide-binding enzyme
MKVKRFKKLLKEYDDNDEILIASNDGANAIKEIHRLVKYYGTVSLVAYPLKNSPRKPKKLVNPIIIMPYG